MPLKKQERKEEYSSVIGLMLQGKNKEAFDKLACMCGKDTGLFIMADYDKEIAKFGGQCIDIKKDYPKSDEVGKVLGFGSGYAFECEFEDGFWCNIGGEDMTHWMPLPEAPTKQDLNQCQKFMFYTLQLCTCLLWV